MNMPEMVVGRDRAHVRALLELYPGREVISASAFFDKVRIVAFLANPFLQRDDHAPLLFAQNLLAENEIFPLNYAANCAQAYSALFHGTIPPAQVYAQICHQEYSFKNAIQIASQIQERMEKQNLVNGVSALYCAWRVCEEKMIIPPGLVKSPTISLRYLIDLSSLEVEVIKALSRLGIKFDICFPLDFAKRALNVAGDFAAKQFESSADLTNIELCFDKLASAGPLAPLVEGLLVDGQRVSIDQDHCQLYEALSLEEEANHLASCIAHLKTNSPSDSVALVMRSYDQRSTLFKRALWAHNISVKDRKGLPFLESPAGILLEIILASRLGVLTKSDFLSLITHPLFCHHLSDDTQRSELYELLNQLGIDDRFLALNPEICRYEKALCRWQQKLDPDDPRVQQARFFHEVLSAIKNILGLLKPRDSFAGFLSSLLQIITSSFQDDNTSVQALLDHIRALMRSAAHQIDNPQLELRDLVALLKASLSKLTVARPDHPDQGAVEFLLVPELVGRSFDHVFIADVSFGQMPKNPKIDPILSDEQRLMLNQALGRQVLRVFLDDPFEPLPVPPRQALEPFWFATALAAATKSVHVSYARHNQSGVEQAPSEFFTWLRDHVTTTAPSRPQHKLQFCSPEYARFLQGRQERLLGQGSRSPQLLALTQRKQAFKNKRADLFAFSFEPMPMIESFAGRLGPKPWRALTPTMVEAFASCRFYGVLTRIMGLNKLDLQTDDLDARVLGQIAHQSLERFFAAPMEPHDLGPKLKAVLTQVGIDYESAHYLASPEIFWCYLDWLYEALLKLAKQIVHTEGHALSAPLAQEQAFGLGPHALPALPVMAGTQAYLLGGVIDRVDSLGEHIVVMDYKLSSADTLRVTGSATSMLKTNFQVPIYVRLAAEAWAHGDRERVSFAFASIRDGQLLPALSAARHAELFKRIFDDTHPESLAAALDRIFRPLSLGEALASKGEQCSMCDFAYVCRYAEGHARD